LWKVKRSHRKSSRRRTVTENPLDPPALAFELGALGDFAANVVPASRYSAAPARPEP
jgi:hypothetical protein